MKKKFNLPENIYLCQGLKAHADKQVDNKIDDKQEVEEEVNHNRKKVNQPEI